MSKGTKKGRTERRKHPRSASAKSARTRTPSSAKTAKAAPKTETHSETHASLPSTTDLERCYACEKALQTQDRALFVEEEIGRVFCSEDCITNFFQPEIERLEKEYFRLRPKDDLTPDEREQFAHLRWVTLQEPDEVWQSKSLTGDHRYTLISEFKPADKTVWCVCTCLFLRGEPSFLYLAFPTKSASLVNHFRKGERMEWVKPGDAQQTAAAGGEGEPATDGLARDWTESETLRAEIHSTRHPDDIPTEEFALYEHLLEKALEEPDELWVLESKDEGEPDTYHFIRRFDASEVEDAPENEPIWYVVIAQEAAEEEQLEILEHFPTRKQDTVDRFRRGRQEIEGADESAPSKMVH